MDLGIIIIPAIVCIIICVIGASLMASAAAEKGYGPEYHIMAKCFWLGILGYLYTICLPDKTLQKQNEMIKKDLIQKEQKTVSDELPDL